MQQSNVLLEQRRILLKEQTTTATTQTTTATTQTTTAPTQTTTINQMVDGPFQFYFDADTARNYYVYKQGKTEQEAKFYVYYQDNPTNYKAPDKLTRLDKKIHDTLEQARKWVRDEIASEKNKRDNPTDMGGYYED